MPAPRVLTGALRQPGTSSHGANPFRTASARVLMAGCEMSFSMKPCSLASITPESALQIGPTIATGSVRIRRWAISARRPAAYAANFTTTWDRLRKPRPAPPRCMLRQHAPDGVNTAATLPDESSGSGQSRLTGKFAAHASTAARSATFSLPRPRRRAADSAPRSVLTFKQLRRWNTDVRWQTLSLRKTD